MPEFQEADLEGALRRAFMDRKADFIVVDGHDLRSEFLRESLALGLTQGWLVKDKNIDEDDWLGRSRGQWYAFTYRLSKKGKKYFGISDN